MINGDGFFVTNAGGQQLYTRAGSFDVDGTGRLHTPDGAILQGWMANNGTINTNGPLVPLQIPYGQAMPPAATTNGIIEQNLSADAAVGTQLQAQATMYDSKGTAHQISYTFTRTAGGWDMKAFNGGTPITFTDNTGVALTAPADTTTSMLFNSSGVLQTTNLQPGKTVCFNPGVAGWNAPVTLDVSGLTMYGGASTMTTSTPVTGQGSALGTLQSFSLGDDGVITGVYSNGLKQPIGQLAIATFANPGGLTKAGNSSFEEATNSGTPSIGTAGTGGRGTLSAGALEMSNVDLAQEFTGLIIAQRGFQANSKVITTSDQILQDLVQMKQ
jgi:flagellar hook protein FlgE